MSTVPLTQLAQTDLKAEAIAAILAPEFWGGFLKQNRVTLLIPPPPSLPWSKLCLQRIGNPSFHLLL
ncbi:hypothetical protein [Laspinema olomoucense]|uniref:Uncharacterized protein n=1 Tax=Laspinema olomoucense D3b TaxID=2953688 RepID=A0ABT2NDC5_9CYAN|nr:MULTISPECIES: hypothetical protein [unclassified Laspinema]MCT7974272.1 hypothetical protein [Laspinema sp. D3d]MCT7980696.1 hypothetical protein [Laspinema sp. D3b]MCT7991245.1 hypothetical protein [Laspinema sp. D3a]MCT7996951.1 hypothetical protein [Laspinema sp. D3c]